MTIALFKWIATLATFATALIGGLLPLWHYRQRRAHNFISIGQALASGIFLGAALLHMLPDAAHDLQSWNAAFPFPWANLIAALGFISLLFMERLIERVQQLRNEQPQSIIHYLLLIVLSIHSLVEGTAMGVNLTLAGTLIIFIAIVAHKGLASFALTIKLITSNVRHRYMVYLIVLFAAMTPIGVGVGAMASDYLHGSAAIELEGIFNAFAAGSFLYIATMHTLDGLISTEERLGVFEIVSIITGLLAMGIIAIWI